MFYEEQKRERKMEALKENEIRKENNEKLKQQETEPVEENTVEEDGKSLESALNEIDPWMQRKMEQELNENTETELSTNNSE